MRILGYCLKCYRVRQVRVSGSGMALAQHGVAWGVCASCEEKETKRRG